MGTSYETMLVKADINRLMAAWKITDRTVILAPAASERTAVIPQEGPHDYAPTERLARQISGGMGFPVVVFQVSDSDVISAQIYRGGDLVHDYTSNLTVLAMPYEDENGDFWLEYRGVRYPLGATLPSGPDGDDPVPFLSFGVGLVDVARLGAALSGPAGGGKPYTFAEDQHAAILAALNLDPRPLTVAFRHVPHRPLAGAVLISPQNQPA